MTREWVRMAAKKKRRSQPAAAQLPPEERRAEVATIAWMLCTLFTFCSEAVSLVAKVALSRMSEPEGEPTAWSLFPDVALLMGVVTGAFCLVLTPVVYRLRKTPPPAAITAVAVLVGLAPWASLLLRWLRGV